MNQFSRNTRVRRMNATAMPMIKRAFALTMLSLLAACGGGGGGSSGSSVSPPTYTGDNLAVFTQLNAVRQSAGAGTTAQNAALDTAAASHASYLVNNSLVTNAAYLNSVVGGILGGHYEDTSIPGYVGGFTGCTPQARATAAGYSGTVNELLSFGATTAADCTASIENSVYHLVQLIAPFTEIGLSFNAGSGSGPVCAIELGVGSTAQLPAIGSWVSYPANGQINVAPAFYNQAESPVPAADLSSAGHPVAISLYNQSNSSLLVGNIVLHTFTLTALSSPVSARVLAQPGVGSDGTALTPDANIPAPGILVLLPTTPLSPNTVYSVAFSATANGAAVSKNWSFTTGNMN